jgi:ABC-type transporter MlaC component
MSERLARHVDGAGAEAMQRFSIGALFGAFLVIFLLNGSPARALDAPTASAFVEQLMQDAVSELAGKSMSREDRAGVLARLLDRYADTKATADELLGRHLANTSEDDQARFRRTFVQYILASWTDYLADLSPGQKLVVTQVEPQADRLLIHTLASVPGEEPTPVEWSVAATADGRPYVADVAMGGVGIVRMMRADFTSVLFANRGRVDGLIAALQKKIEFAAATRHAEAPASGR